MLKYQCRYCGAIKDPDGQDCQCGASHSSLRIINEREQEEKIRRLNHGQRIKENPERRA